MSKINITASALEKDLMKWRNDPVGYRMLSLYAIDLALKYLTSIALVGLIFMIVSFKCFFCFCIGRIFF